MTTTTTLAMATDKALATPVEQLTLAEQVGLHVAIKALCEAGEARLAALKDSLTIYTSAKGAAEGDKGTVALVIDSSKVSVEKRTAKNPDLDGILALCASKGIAPSEATDTVSTLVINPSKITYLLATGKVSEAEINALRPVTPALRIYPSKALKALIAPFKALCGKAEK